MNFYNVEAAVKVIKVLIYGILAQLMVTVFLGVSLYVKSNTIDKLNLSLTAKESDLYACKAQRVTLSSALSEQTREVEKHKIDLAQARKDIESKKPHIIKRYEMPKLDINATCEAKLSRIEKIMEVYHADR